MTRVGLCIIWADRSPQTLVLSTREYIRNGDFFEFRKEDGNPLVINGREVRAFEIVVNPDPPKSREGTIN